LIAIQNDYRDEGVQLVAINPNDAEKYPDDSFEKMKERAAAKSFNFPYLRDESQAVARAYDAACTPDVFVFDRDRKLLYNGRIDDNWKEPAKVTRQELRELLDAALQGASVDFEHIPSMGCSIKWK
jgi:peroxiredoxin